MDNELLLYDRLKVIQQTITDENKFYLSFSGGKDSTVLHYLLDMALPGNKIPRVFINTGIEYQKIVRFVQQMAEQDGRFVILKPEKNIKTVLEQFGYPFKSKEHSHILGIYQRNGKSTSVKKYLKELPGNRQVVCPEKLKYQFSEEFKLKVSDKCCRKLKKDPVKKWERENDRTVAITGMRQREGGARLKLTCIVTDNNDNLIKFHPLAVVDDDWEQWFIDKYQVKLCELYYPPYNFKRTGCKGCPFALNLKEELKTLENFMPTEKKHCELIWAPVYQEYRRINYRLSKYDQLKIGEM